MSTKAQVKANQQNAQKSTGPQTAQGKAVVSQNAVKHGLFAAEAVITGENPAVYEAYHDQFLVELVPVGMVESMLAARVVSLAWRLQRAERMQNQVIDDMIGRIVTNNPARRKRECYYDNQGIRAGDPRFDLDNLPLGRIATRDWSNCKVLDRLFMYERRIENSMHKTINKLKTYQSMRVIQEAEIRKPEPAPAIPKRGTGFQPVEHMAKMAMPRDQAIPSLRDEAATRRLPAEKKGDLKKQTQFAPAQMGATSYLKGDYDNKPAGGAYENKANPSGHLMSVWNCRTDQSQSHAHALPK